MLIKLPRDTEYPVGEEIIRCLERYLNNGIMPGSFMTAVIENSLVGAFGRADLHNEANLKNIVGYVYKHVPASAWGNADKVSRYVERLREAESKIA